MMYSICKGQNPYKILQHDTTIPAGTNIELSIDSIKALSNFIFSAEHPLNQKWTIWGRNHKAGKYTPLFSDKYNRSLPVVSADRTEMIYVRYRSQQEGAMHTATMDTAWICRSKVDGSEETIIIEVPQFNKNAVYDLDWSPDKERLIYAWGNDAFPSLTRDGDIFEYNLNTRLHTNLTNTWDYFSRHCRYGADGHSVLFGRNGAPWYPGSTDVFVCPPGGSALPITTSKGHNNEYVYCTLTGRATGGILYRRGQYGSNKLYANRGGRETVLSSMPGYGGTEVANGLYAATDFENSIYIFTASEVQQVVRVSSISSFSNDNRYHYPQDFNTHLNWAGKQPVNVQWSNGETGMSIKVAPEKSTTYRCLIEANGKKYKDSIRIIVTGKKPTIYRKCLTLVSSNGNKYQWMKDGIEIKGATDSSYTTGEAGRFSVRVENEKGQNFTSAELKITGSEGDSLASVNNRIAIVADPNTFKIKIVSPTRLNIVITDDEGRIVHEVKNTTEVDMSQLPDGPYAITAFNNDCIRLKTQRIIKKSD